MCAPLGTELHRSPGPHLSYGVAHILVDGVGHLCSLHAGSELHVQDPRVVPQPPVIRFVACQPGTVDARLLTRADADDLQQPTAAATLQRDAATSGRRRVLPVHL